MIKFILLSSVMILTLIVGYAQEEEGNTSGEQDRASKAMDATATKWDFELAYLSMPDYYNDVVDGTDRPPGIDNYLQFRIVAPIPLKGWTILPRITLRHYENIRAGKSGMGNTEIFALIVPKATDWGTGRAGIGPLITTPGNKDVAKDEWGYGIAAAIVNNSGQWFYGLLFTQSWRSIDPSTLPAGVSDSNPLGITPFLNYRFATSGFYLGTADLVALYDWNTKGFYLPIGARIGKVWVRERASWKFYAEYKTSAVYKSWQGPAVKNSYKINVSYTIPIGNK